MGTSGNNNLGICNRRNCRYHASEYSYNNCDYCTNRMDAGETECVRGCPPGHACTKFEKGEKHRKNSIWDKSLKVMSDEDMLSLLDKGYSDTAIAAQYHLPPSIVKRRREKLGRERNYTRISPITGKPEPLTPRYGKKGKPSNDT